MDALARAYSPELWSQRPQGIDSIAADAVTIGLRTTENTLTLWQCVGDGSDVRDVALAIAAGRKALDRLFLVLVPRSAIDTEVIQVRTQAGGTPVADLAMRHVNLVGLDADRLVTVARLIRRSTADAGRCHVFQEEEILDLLRAAIAAGRLHQEHLRRPLRDSIQNPASNAAPGSSLGD